MMIVSAKVSKRKLLTGAIAAAAIILLLVFLCGRAGAEPSDTPEDTPVTGEAATNEQRLTFLQSFGWELDKTPQETREVRIPETFNEVFSRYNQLQQSQGYDLEPFAGKAAKRYVYRILNHPDGADHFATLIVHKDRIIGGDITGTGPHGSIHGFAMPEPGSKPHG